MKVIEKGTLPSPPIKWWLEITMTCGYCHARFQLEESDPFQWENERTPWGKAWVEVACPTCGRMVRTHKPTNWEEAELYR